MCVGFIADAKSAIAESLHFSTRITPSQIRQPAHVRSADRSLKGRDLPKARQTRGDPSMHAEYRIIDQRRNREMIERFIQRRPNSNWIYFWNCLFSQFCDSHAREGHVTDSGKPGQREVQ
jgi:hypothetical protein